MKFRKKKKPLLFILPGIVFMVFGQPRATETVVLVKFPPQKISLIMKNALWTYTVSSFVFVINNGEETFVRIEQS